ncbi:MAG: spermidine synthase, partial [Nannocystaceae bacterium]
TLGTLGAVYVLMPSLGLPATVSAWAIAGCLAAVLALRWSRRHPPLPPKAAPAIDPTQPAIDCSKDPDSDLLLEPWLLYMVVFTTGLAGVGLEVVGVTVLAQNFENTIYTFANTLAVFLLGTALGAAIYQRVIGKLGNGRPTTVLVALLGMLALSTVLGALALAASPSLIAVVHPETHGTLATGVGGEMLATLAVFGLPTLCMGALFSHVVGLLSLSGGAGRAYALNTLGDALAPLVFGVLAIDALGFADAYYAITYTYLAVFIACAWIRRFRPQIIGAGVLAVIALTAIGPRELALVPPDPTWKVLSQDQSIHGVVTVSEYTGARPPKAPPLRRLQVGHQFRMGGALSFGERRMGHLSALLAGTPKNLLILGVGTGATAGAAHQASAAHASLEAVELVPGVAEALPLFTEVNRRVYQEPEVEVHVADARRFLAASAPGRDLVIADLFHPARDGAGALYAREHFEAVRDHLAPGGVFVQWLPLHQLSPTNLKTIVRTFLA